MCVGSRKRAPGSPTRSPLDGRCAAAYNGPVIRIVTLRNNIIDLPRRWREEAHSSPLLDGKPGSASLASWERVYDALCAIDLTTATVADLDAIMPHFHHWVQPACQNCEAEVDEVIEFDNEAQELQTHLCRACLAGAAALVVWPAEGIVR